MSSEHPSTHEKALQINVDARRYGTFAEIGGGQEVARWFFRVGGAAGTVAKTISAYDMAVSDAIYGPAGRYVSRQRLQDMLDYEFKLLDERLSPARGDSSGFFVFANTVATRSFSRREEGHGWLGVRFQAEPHEAPSELVIHARLLDDDNWREQEALGILGVNLLHAAFTHHHRPETLVEALMDDLAPGRVEIDMINFSGPAFAGVDNRLMSLHLVRLGFSMAALFTAQGEVVQPADLFYKKPVVVERGTFRPVTNTTLEILESAAQQMAADSRLEGHPPLTLFEMTLRSLLAEPYQAHRDFLARVDTLTALGHAVLISNFGAFHRLIAYLARHTQAPVGIALGIPSLRKLLDREAYADLEGGLLESLGRLFKRDARLLVYPSLEVNTGRIVTAEDLHVAPTLQYLYAHLLENDFLVPVRHWTRANLGIIPAEVRAKLESGDPGWKPMVPKPVAELIERERLFGWKSA
jgi:hypothetical protein